MAVPAHVAVAQKGPRAWNEWRLRECVTTPDLSYADLRAVDLHGADLSNALLWRTDFAHANLARALFNRAQVSGTNFDSAVLSEAIFDRAWVTSLLAASSFRGASLLACSFANAILEDCDLTGADLTGATFINATLRRLRVTGAILNATFGDTLIAETDLSDAAGLASARHIGPSDIYSAIEHSRGSLPRQFMLGCGLSPNRVPSVQHVPTLFISYSHHDTTFAERLDSALKSRGFPCWRDARDLVAGDLGEQIERAIHDCDVLLVVLSKDALKSDWVEHEVRAAVRLERKSRRNILCPIALDDEWLHADWSAMLTDRIKKNYVVDFNGWRCATEFDQQLERVVAGLRRHYAVRPRDERRFSNSSTN